MQRHRRGKQRLACASEGAASASKWLSSSAAALSPPTTRGTSASASSLPSVKRNTVTSDSLLSAAAAGRSMEKRPRPCCLWRAGPAAAGGRAWLWAGRLASPVAGVAAGCAAATRISGVRGGVSGSVGASLTRCSITCRWNGSVLKEACYAQGHSHVPAEAAACSAAAATAAKQYTCLLYIYLITKLSSRLPTMVSCRRHSRGRGQAPSCKMHVSFHFRNRWSAAASTPAAGCPSGQPPTDRALHSGTSRGDQAS